MISPAVVILATVMGAATPEELERTAINTTCPVMVGSEVDSSIYVDYRGRRVYLCCLTCQAAFQKEPRKYLSHLPQFAAGPGREEARDARSTHEFSAARLIKPLGVLAATLLVATACAGFFMRKRPRLLRKLHKVLAVATLGAVLVHAILVLSY